MPPPTNPPHASTLPWQRQGPLPSTDGQVEKIPDREVVGAIQAIAPHPANPDILYIAAVNGGIWRTDNALAARPQWTPLADDLPSLSFGALEFDPTDANLRTLVAGTGRFSSNRRSGGALIGVLRTTDGGTSWAVLGGPFANLLHICGVAARGATIVVATNNGGIFRTTDTGATWSNISADPHTGLPPGNAFDLAGDPANPTRLFTHSGTSGLFRSTDTGATWTKISSSAIDTLLAEGATNVKISVGAANNVYVAIAGNTARLAGLFHSHDGGNTWHNLDLPRTVEAGGVVFGIHPGGQAGIHMSLAADRQKPQLVYIGGDRQPGFNEGVPPGGPTRRFPNSLEARDYSGRLFRIDASRPSGSQVTPLTHVGTANGSAPHADSRDMAIAANGMLFEADDGGIYRRSSPQDTHGDWFSMIGDLTTTEFHSVAWDANCLTVIGGAQDTGSPQQVTGGTTRWQSVSTGDGGVVAVDAMTVPGFSTRYSSFNKLLGFRRQVFDANGVLQSSTFVGLRVASGPQLVPHFYTPIELNAVRPIRMIVGAANGVYESTDQGDTLRSIAAFGVNDTGPIAYGALGNPDALYVGSGISVFIRTAAPPAPLARSGTYPGVNPVVGIALVPNDARSAFVIDAVGVFHTADAGATWQDITHNLARPGTVLRSVAYCGDLGAGAVVVGTNNAVFACEQPFAQWLQIGIGLPRAPVTRLRYSDVDRILLAGTLGRGAWTLTLPAPVIV